MNKLFQNQLRSFKLLLQENTSNITLENLKFQNYEIHKLRGAALAMNCLPLSKTLEHLEEVHNHILANGNETSQTEDWFQKRTYLIQKLIEYPEDELSKSLSVRSDRKNSQVTYVRERALIYLVDDDPLQIEQIKHQIEYYGYSVKNFQSIDELKDAIREETPAAIIMDIIFPEGDYAGTATIEEIQATFNHPLPVIFISSQDTMKSRLNAVHANGSAYLTKPVDINKIINTLDHLLKINLEETYRVLLIEDSEFQREFYAKVLQRAGIITRVLSDPLNLHNTLVDFNPDLILMDMYMPDYNGIELSRVIRQIEEFVSIPIVFLSAEDDKEIQLKAMQFGGEDFLTKPIKPKHLILSIQSRISRYRELRTLMIRDGLTRMYNHTTINAYLEQEVSRSERTKNRFCVAMLDLDHFKIVNDTYGHIAGDQVLKNLSNLIHQNLRQSDMVGRYGGEEFLILMPGATLQQAANRMNDIRERFEQITHTISGHEFTVTFSCGITWYPKRNTAISLRETADEMLYKAKSMGRNKVICDI
ncbi:MAG: diguanylate cyclase [Anaerolineaceae bacterium]|nr:diguanylate cyclase [Anaerolineaceae bacterium]